MVVLDPDMRAVVSTVALGFVATVNIDSTPNLSPKGTTEVWDEERLVFLDLYSPNTVANLRRNPAVEINVVDPLRRKGYRFRGTGEVLTSGDLFDRIVARFTATRGTDPAKVDSAVLVRVDSAAPLISPAYDDGSSETEVTARWRRRLLGDH